MCIKCGRTLSLNNFSSHKKSKDRLEYSCKSCINERNRQNYIRNKEAIKKTVKRYSEENKEKMTSKRYLKKEDANSYAREWIKIKANKEKVKIYRKINKINIQIYNKNYRINNKLKADNSRKHWEERHVKERFEYHKQYAKDHADEYNIRSQTRNALKLSLPCNLTIHQWEIIKLKFDNKCCYCNKELPLEQEHFIPITNEGEYTINNIIPSCKSCNCSKSNKVFENWYPTYKYYSKKREKIILDFLGYSNNKQQLKII